MVTHGASRALDQPTTIRRRFARPRLPKISLTVRLMILVLIAVCPAIAIQAYNEYELRKAREADIRQQVVQITRQFGEEIGELREGARQLLLALAQLTPVKQHDGAACSELFATLEAQMPITAFSQLPTLTAAYSAPVNPWRTLRSPINHFSSAQWPRTGWPSAIIGPIRQAAGA